MEKKRIELLFLGFQANVLAVELLFQKWGVLAFAPPIRVDQNQSSSPGSPWGQLPGSGGGNSGFGSGNSGCCSKVASQVGVGGGSFLDRVNRRNISTLIVAPFQKRQIASDNMSLIFIKERRNYLRLFLFW